MKKAIRSESIESELSRNAIKAALYEESYRDAWREIIYWNGPYVCFLTLKFQRSYSDSIAIPSVNQFFYNMNRQLFGRRWWRKKWGFTGMVIAEQNRLRASDAGDLHFHCLLNPNDHIQTEDDFVLLRDRAVLSATRLKDAKGRHMCSLPQGVDVRPIHDLSGITRYVVKEFDDYMSESGDQIYFLDYRGLEAGCLDQWRKRTC